MKWFVMQDNKIKFALEFMTIACDAKPLCKKKAPGVVHIDGTARPQIINKKINLSCYEILRNYYEITALPILINTSFNIHEEPIVNSPEEAIKTFLEVLSVSSTATDKSHLQLVLLTQPVIIFEY